MRAACGRPPGPAAAVEFSAEHRQAIESFGEDTRDDTLTRAAEKIRKTQFKISAYAEFLADEKGRLDRELARAREELRARVEQLAAVPAG